MSTTIKFDILYEVSGSGGSYHSSQHDPIVREYRYTQKVNVLRMGVIQLLYCLSCVTIVCQWVLSSETATRWMMLASF